MLLAAGRKVVSKTSAYNITKLSYRVEVHVCGKGAAFASETTYLSVVSVLNS